jgi:hypothetical protein
MHRFGFLYVALVAASTALPVRAADSPKDIIEKAIEAHGGKEALKKDVAGRMDMKGTVQVMGVEVSFTGKYTYQHPGKIRGEISMDIMCNKFTIVQIVNGDKVKMTFNGMDAPLTDEQKEEFKQSVLADNVHRLTPLLDDKGYELKAIDNPGKVGDKETVAFEVSGNGLKQTKLFFDKKSGTLLKEEREAIDQAGAKVKQDTLFLDYKKVDGKLMAMKWEIQHDGKKHVAIEASGFERLEKVDPTEFDISD